MVNKTSNPLDEFGYQDTNHPDYNRYYDPEWIINNKLGSIGDCDMEQLRIYWFAQWAFVANDLDNTLAYEAICESIEARDKLTGQLEELRKMVELYKPTM